MTRFARRQALRGGEELATILAGTPPGVLSMTGGFPNPATFPTEVLAEIAQEVLPTAMQYTPVAGLPSVRQYLAERLGAASGDEVLVTSGGMECIQLVCQALLDPGDVVAVEAPTYLGALMAFRAAEARLEGLPMDEDGLLVEALEERLAGGLRPKVVYVIPEHQNPTGRTMPLERRRALVDLCRRYELLLFEDVAYRELAFDGEPPPSLWSLAPDVVVQAGTFSKVFTPGVRLGWAAGPPDVLAELAAVKGNTDQCTSALAQRMVEAYGRSGHFERFLPEARALYASHWRALEQALEAHLPDGCSWTTPAGGFLTWLRLPGGLDSDALRPRAIEAGVAYVPGRPFYAGDGGHDELRLSFSSLGPAELEEAVRRLAGVVA